MELLDPREQDARRQAIEAGMKELALRVPLVGDVLSPLLAGWDAYQQARDAQYILALCENVQIELQGVKESVGEWYKTPAGQQFVRKTVDAALDAQLEEKHQLLARALVNGLRTQHDDVKKLLFVDLIRRLSLNALLVLAEFDRLYGPQVALGGRATPGQSPSPQIIKSHVIPELCDGGLSKLHPYMVEQAMEELTAAGLFSIYSSWRYDSHDRKYRAESSVSAGGAAMFYTQFAYDFAVFLKTQAGQAS